MTDYLGVAFRVRCHRWPVSIEVTKDKPPFLTSVDYHSGSNKQHFLSNIGTTLYDFTEICEIPGMYPLFSSSAPISQCNMMVHD